jgi:hypothetical protein
VVLWDVPGRRQVGRWACRFGVSDVRFVSGGTGWAVSGMGEDVELWNPGTAARPADRPEAILDGRALITPDGSTLLISGEGQTRRWDLQSGTFLAPLLPMGSLMGISRDGLCAISVVPPDTPWGLPAPTP